MAGEMAKVNYYALLGVDRDASEKKIKMRYYKLALKWHPDKNPDNPEAADKFALLSKAYDTLMDTELRRQYDAGVRGDMLKQQRESEMDSKRRRAKSVLEEREEAAKKARRAEQEKEWARKAELDRLRAQGRAAQHAHQQHVDVDDDGLDETPVTDATVVLKWKGAEPVAWDETKVREVLNRWGPVDAVVLSVKRGGLKGTIMVDMHTRAGAIAVVHAQASARGGLSAKLRVPLTVGEKRARAAQAKREEAQSARVSLADLESVTMMRMKREQERRRIIAEMLRAEAEGKEVDFDDV